jgi:tetratricopeptide (TPR) repeat protein
MDTHEAGIKELIAKARLGSAQELMHCGKLEEAERLYKQTLRQAEADTDESNMLVALVLLEMFDFYENQGRNDEAKPIWSRMRKIVLMNLPEKF